jgi:hypothetical protein
MVLPPRRFAIEMYEIRTGDTVMVAFVAPTRSRREPYRVIRVGMSLVTEALGFLGADSVESEPDGSVNPRRSLVSVQCGHGASHHSPTRRQAR